MKKHFNLAVSQEVMVTGTTARTNESMSAKMIQIRPQATDTIKK